MKAPMAHLDQEVFDSHRPLVVCSSAIQCTHIGRKSFASFVVLENRGYRARDLVNVALYKFVIKAILFVSFESAELLHSNLARQSGA